MNPAPFHSVPLSRRRVLSLAAGAAAALLTGASCWRSAAQALETPLAATPVALGAAGTPLAGTPTAAPPALPSTLAADTSPEFRAVAAALAAAMQQFQVPGAALGLLADGREEHVTFGLASLSSLRPVTPDTLFQIGSLTKTFTSTVVWRLIDEGALALDAPVRTYLPDFTLQDAEAAATVTIGNLLDHSAGWYGDEGFDTGDNDDALARYVAERLPQLPQIFPVGAYFSYNNAAFALLGRLLEVVTGATYNAAMADLLFDPLGLADTLLERDAVWARPFADGHVAMPINGEPSLAVQIPLWVPRSVDPAGGIWSTTRDVIRYARFHMNAATADGPANLVHPDSLRQMQQPAMPIPGISDMQMGRDWFIQDVAGERAIMHGGDTLGQHTEFVAIPARGFALVVLTNGQGGGALAARAALDTALAQFPALAPLSGTIGLTAALLAPPDAPKVSLPADGLAKYAGRYADPSQALILTEEDGALTLTVELAAQPGAYQPALPYPVPPPAPIEFLAEDMAVAGPMRVPFVRDADGHVRFVSSGLRLIPHVAADR